MINFSPSGKCIQLAYHLSDLFGEHYTSVRMLGDDRKKPAKLENASKVIQKYKAREEEKLIQDFSKLTIKDKKKANKKEKKKKK